MGRVEAGRRWMEAGRVARQGDGVRVRFARGTQEIEPMRTLAREDEVAQLVHDLRNPLATIALEAGLIDELLVDGERSEVMRVSARIRNNVLFLDRMVQDLLDLCALEAGGFRLRRASVDLRALLETVIERAVPSRDRHRVSLEASSSLVVNIDELRIERVVANLIDNALKHAPTSADIAVRMDVTPSGACVSVVDAGGGIPPSDLGRLFDKYRRGGSVACAGSGLGLYVSRQIVEAHGGRIGVESVRGAGSRFFFDLPVS